jgi:hypothetical protein
MKDLSRVERFWGTLAHVPIITIIWVIYMVYHYYNRLSVCAVMHKMKAVTNGSLPLMPILFTLAALPISLGIMYAKKTSPFVYRNAESAYQFNLWLLMCYAVAFAGSALGFFLHKRLILMAFGIAIAIISTFSLAQAACGVFVAFFRGRVFYYWYPGRRLK